MRRVSLLHPGQRLLCWACAVFLTASIGARGVEQAPSDSAGRTFEGAIKPLVGSYCLKCHSSEKHKGDIDLEQFTSVARVFKHPKPWQQALEQFTNGEMPPKDKPQPTPEERKRFIEGVNSLLDEVALAHAGDPGPVVLRRLYNAEYTYTIRDLTGVESLDPAREFPADSASGEGFMNVGNSLVMSPSLLTKYLDAAKEIANHAVLLPDGIRFFAQHLPARLDRGKAGGDPGFLRAVSPRTAAARRSICRASSSTPRTAEYCRCEKYLAATLAEREAIKAGKEVNQRRWRANAGLNAKYLGTLWTRAQRHESFARARSSARAVASREAEEMAARCWQTIRQWQQALWRFTTVGHIGKRDGPKAWQVPVTPLAERAGSRDEVPLRRQDKEVTLYLVRLRCRRRQRTRFRCLGESAAGRSGPTGLAAAGCAGGGRMR